MHLCHVLCYNLDDTDDINARCRLFCSQANCFFTRFNYLMLALKSQLFKTYCQSFSGSQLWDFNCAALNTFDISWCKAVRRLWGVPYRTHRDDNFIHIIASHFSSLAYSCLITIKYLFFFANNARISPLTYFSKNLQIYTSYLISLTILVIC